MVESEEDLDAQIAALQARKAAQQAAKVKAARKQAEEERKVLVGATPTKKASINARAHRDESTSPSRSSRISSSEAFGPKQAIPATSFYGSTKSEIAPPPRQNLPSLPTTHGSKMSMGLASMRRNPSSEKAVPIARSTSFAGRPAATTSNAVAGPSRPKAADPLPAGETAVWGSEELQTYGELEIDDSGVRRDGALEIVEKLQLGPGTFGKDPEGEDVWAFLEPNSKIRLSKRSLPHADLQDFLYGRYLVSPSQLYSIIRLSRDGSTYDVPVDGDWITIAVVAERGEVRISGSKAVDDGDNEEGEDDSESEEDETGASKSKAKAKASHAKPPWNKKWMNNKAPPEDIKKRRPKKYINLKLCALPPRASSKSSSPSGDALLQLLLFESDNVVSSDAKDGQEKTVIYRGGSGGAYEKWCTLAPGDVVGLLNPRVLRPLKAGKASPHPLTLPLALNPTDQDGIILIGQARDLGCCSAQQRDGSRCKSWVDLRQGPVCEYHISQALSRGRAGRAEFASASSSFSSTRTSSGGVPSGGGDPRYAAQRGVFGGNKKKEQGMIAGGGAYAAPRGPDNGGGGATYVVGGKTISTSGGGGGRGDGGPTHFGAEHLSEKLGRSRAEKRKRKMEEKEQEEVLRKLVDGGSTGGKYLKAIDAAAVATSVMGGKRKSQSSGIQEKKKDEEEEKKRTFGAHMIQKIGFDPHRIGMSEKEKEGRAESIKKLRMTGKGFDERARVKRVNVRPPPGSNASGARVVSRGDEAGQEDTAMADNDDEGMVDLG